MTQSLSACLIVKNESNVLDRCLSSLQPIFDDIVIIDTGSTDNTKEIALKYTNKIFDFTWVNDFAVARNESLKYATGEWILVIDADEYIKETDIEKFKHFFATTDKEEAAIYSLNIISYLGDNNSTSFSEDLVGRIVPNFKGFFFERPIHEQLTNNYRTAHYAAPLELYHTGYTEEIRIEKNKSDRNLSIFEELKKKKVFTAYDYFTLGNEYGITNNAKEAYNYYLKAYKKSSFTIPWEIKCASEVYKYYLSNKRYADCIDVINTAFKNYKEYPEYYTLYGMVYYELGLFAKAKTYFQQALTVGENKSVGGKKFVVISPQYATSLPLIHLVNIAIIEMDVGNIVYYCTKMLNIEPYSLIYLQLLFIYLTPNSTDEEIIVLLNRIYDTNSSKDIALIFSVAIKTGNFSLAQYFYSKIENKEIIPIKPHIIYAITTSNQNLFEVCFSDINRKNISLEIVLNVLVAQQLWQVDYFTKLPIEDWNEYEEVDKLYEYLRSDQNNDATSLDFKLVGSYLTTLFSTQNYNLYDKQLPNLINSDIVNFLATYFVTQNKLDIAITYLDTLLREYEPNETNLMYLARLHIADGLVEEAIPFFEEVINMNPDVIAAYSAILYYSSSREQKLIYKQKLYNALPVTRKLDVIKKI